METRKIESIDDLKKRREQKHYKALVLGAWDRFEHTDNRERQERRADIERAARQRL